MTRRLVVAFLTQPFFLSVARIFACPPFQVEEDEDEGCLIYAAVNVHDGKMYVGLSVNDLRHRQSSHFSQSRRPTDPFHYALAKYGRDAFVWFTVHGGLSDKTLDDAETYYIKTLMTRCNIPGHHGYNVRAGGRGNCESSVTWTWYDGEAVWTQRFQEYLEFLDANQRRPSKAADIESGEYELAVWMEYQQYREKPAYPHGQRLVSESPPDFPWDFKPQEDSHVMEIRTDANFVEDGDKWKKEQSNKRTYYYCRRQGCKACMHVQQAPHNQRLLIVLYKGVHNHHPPVKPIGKRKQRSEVCADKGPSLTAYIATRDQPPPCCTECGALSTTKWRSGPSGPRTLCNGCGQRWGRTQRPKGVCWL